MPRNTLTEKGNTMSQYVTEHEAEAIESLMQQGREQFPNVPLMVTFGMYSLHESLSQLHDQLSDPENQHLAAEVAECISLTREIFKQMEAGYDALVEAQGQTRN